MQTRRKLLLSAALLPLGLTATQAAAQSTVLDPAPIRQPLDENGVDLTSGEIVVPGSSVAIGGENGLQHMRYRVGNGWRHNYLMTVELAGNTATVTLGGSALTFTKVGGVWQNDQGSSSTLTETSSTFMFTGSGGTQITFNRTIMNGASYYRSAAAVATDITAPTGQKTTLHYKTDTYFISHPFGGSYSVNVIRLASVTNNAGYQLKFHYAQNDPNQSSNAWYRITKVTALNNATEYCGPMANTCNFANTWPNLTYAESTSGSDTLETVTDVLGRQARYRTNSADQLTRVKRAGETIDGVVVNYGSDSRVSSVTHQGSQTRTYSWSASGNQLTATTNDMEGRQRTTVSNTSLGVILTDTNGLNQTMQYQYDGDGRLTDAIMPEGDRTEYSYDARGNTTEVRRKAKPGSGLADIVTSANYAVTCSNPITCNLPTSTTDARGKVTNYTWHSTYGVLTDVQLPADSSGIRSRRRFGYGNLWAKAKNASGTLVQFADPILKLTSTRACRTANICTGSANESLTIYTYDNNAAPNLDLRRVNHRAGNGTLNSFTDFTYDKLGNVLTVDGPISGTTDTTTFVYDDAGQRIGTISADPDGSGSLPRLASRTTYNADGQVTKTESGTVTGTSTAAWNAFAPYQEYRTSYDAFGRAKTSSQVLPGTSTQYSITQYSYDDAGCLECTAVRMNAPSTATTLPVSACTPMTAGSFGEDRISRTYYDAADRVTEVWSGVGTSLAQRTGKSTYRANGTLATLLDAGGKKTTYYVDGFDRVNAIRYPHKTSIGQSNASDQETVTYDAAGNILTHRTRRGETISYTYDNLNRVTYKTVPSRSGLSSTHTRDVAYRYDQLGNLTLARFNGTGGVGVTNAYDGRGRLNWTLDTTSGTSR
ncbi:hypothetical protein [Qipengyuania sp. DGS5-3]|uniref:hypothetical protein n=1 Tax=Qipengyuania sp. DGS5-3 TaxID=3349632 RepID=UPI0036D42C27